jgi:hypothetical protein
VARSASVRSRTNQVNSLALALMPAHEQLKLFAAE